MTEFEQVARLLRRHGVLVWLPEAGGPVDVNAPAHRVLMSVLAAQSQREVVRSRHRTMAAMTAQRSNRADSSAAARRTDTGWWTGSTSERGARRMGRRCHRLAPDPATALHVRWMFAERLAGRAWQGSLAS
jgi:DNA invertase Pin-like site-specific DNA recombinase